METGQPLYRKTCKRWDVPFDAHFLTFSCFGRQPFLRSERACRWFLEALEAARRKHPLDLWAYILMPEHVHLVLQPHPGTKISPILKACKLPVTNRTLLWVRANRPEFLKRMADPRGNGKVSHRFWQRGGGYDRNLRNDRELYEKINYIHRNPVSRGLVERPEDWPWSSYRSFFHGGNEPIGLDLDSLPPPPVMR